MNLLGPALALYLKSRVDPWLRQTAMAAGRVQRRLLRRFLARAEGTHFGRRHGFASIRNHADYAKAVPIADYPSRQDLYDRVLHGEPDVLWPGRVRLFARTSGTTAGSKYIPVTPGLKRNQVGAGLAMMAFAERFQAGLVRHIFGGKLMVFGGRNLHPTGTGAMERAIGDIAIRWVPWPFTRHLEPGALNAIEDFSEKVERVARHIVGRDIRFIGHLPTWTMCLLDRVCQVAGVEPDGGITRVWPNLRLVMYGGMNLEPYRAAFERYYQPGRRPHFQQLYPCTEGFIAAQSDPHDPGMELLADNEVVFEFVGLEEWGKPDARRLLADQVEPNIPYGLVLTTSAGLWAYDVGDIVRFTSVRPPRIVFAGRHQHFMNAFGEHVIGEEVAQAVGAAARETGAAAVEFTASPIYPDGRARPVGAHEFLVEFEREPAGGLAAFADAVDRALLALNLNWTMKRMGNHRITPPEVVAVPRGTFYEWMKRRGKLGEQNKVPVCANDRRYVDEILALVAERGGAPRAVGSAVPRGEG
jgi:hypothetical protein